MRKVNDLDSQLKELAKLSGRFGELVKQGEAEFAEMVSGVDLSDREKDVLREDVGLPPKGEVEKVPVLRKRLQMMAWAKLPIKSPQQPAVIKAMCTVMREAHDLGFSTCMPSGCRVFLGEIDPLKACRFKDVREVVTGGTGMINGVIAKQNMQAARRTLVVNHLLVQLVEKHGAIVLEGEDHENSWVIALRGAKVELSISQVN